MSTGPARRGADGGAGHGATTRTIACPHCGCPVDESGAREHAGISRLGCLSCGVQLVRRPGQEWETIRG